MNPVSGFLRHARSGRAARLPRGHIHHAQFLMLVRQATALGLSNATSALILALIVSRVADAALVWTWAGIVAIPTIFNALRAHHNKNAPLPQRIRPRTRRRALLWTGLVGILWGLSPILFFPETGLVQHMFITLIMVGQVAGIMVALNALPSHCILFAITSQVPLVAFLLASGTDAENALATLIVIFNAFMGKAVLTGYRRFMDDLIMKQDLARSRVEAESASRAKSQFLAIMSHELRTPLNSIIGFAELIQRQAQEDGGISVSEKLPHAEYAGYILDSGRHLLSLVSDILDLSRIESGAFVLNTEWVDFGDLCATVFSSFQTKTESLTLTLDMPEEEMEPVRADSRVLRQIITNLLSNACKFTQAGGEVTLKLRRTDTDLVMEVVDTGIGIPADQQAAIFEPFRQVDGDHARRHQGTGLGLPIVKRLAELHGGDIQVESRESAGSRFTVRIPAETAEDDQGA